MKPVALSAAIARSVSSARLLNRRAENSSRRFGARNSAADEFDCGDSIGTLSRITNRAANPRRGRGRRRRKRDGRRWRGPRRNCHPKVDPIAVRATGLLLGSFAALRMTAFSGWQASGARRSEQKRRRARRCRALPSQLACSRSASIAEWIGPAFSFRLSRQLAAGG